MEESIRLLQKFANDKVSLYGINTQVGDDAYRVNLQSQDYADSLIRRQANAMRALGCALGQDCSDEIVRAMLLIRANSHVQGASGVRPLVTEGILNLVNKDILLIIKRYGSVGASGDLIPMSSIGRTLMAEHIVKYNGSIMHAKDLFNDLGIEPIQLQMKEGVAIVNGTSFTSAIAAIAIHKLCYYLPLSISAIAVCCEAMLAMDSSYDPFLHESKHHKSQIEVAAFIRQCWEGSESIHYSKF
ncbi:histidine ammonia-lyase (Histidase) [Legionella nautarum]|uniref:Histidine ammonia-lyase (Histidase) n=1 Tax=Legionella nautarum TaxID=45070 RepID=A0A0W0X3H7_9GAMM|nr:histidine ammonia-lyase (Histidase) [Legionella nautarum]